MRKLAHIETIEWKRPIEGADRIELVGVLGWQCIAKKDEFQVGDQCVYIEIDSIVDKDNPDFAFLEPKHYKIKTQKMRGVLSQGIVFPMSILHTNKKYDIGDDVTDTLKITQVEDELPTVNKTPAPLTWQKKMMNNSVFKWFAKHSKLFRKLAWKLLTPKKTPSKFPDWIIKTDEIRLQNMPHVLETHANKPMIVTEKIDGTSTSFGMRKEGRKKYDYAICSRNIRQTTPKQQCYYGDNVYYEIAEKYNIREVLMRLIERYNATTVVLQGETIGEGIQKNKYHLKGHDFYAFNLVVDGLRIDSSVAAEVVKEYGINWVPILDTNFTLLDNVDDMMKYADGQSKIYDTLREGVVIRDHDNTTSFKCVSNAFLLKHNL